MTDGVGVILADRVGVILTDRVGVNVVVTDGVGVGETKQLLQSGHQKSYRLKRSFNILKLCCIWGADKGSTYILNWDIPPINEPAKFGSIIISVVKPDKLVPDKVWFGINSGSWMYGPSVLVHALNTKLSLRPCVPPPKDILKGTPNCFSFSVFNSWGIISSKSEIVINL